MRTRTRSSRKTHIQTWPMALAIVLAVAIYTHPIIGLCIALGIAGIISGIVIAAVTYVVLVLRGKAKLPARVIRDRKNEKWSVEFM